MVENVIFMYQKSLKSVQTSANGRLKICLLTCLQ